VYVSEESHCGVVPMNYSNKDRILSAESEEGRLRLKENILSPDTYPTLSGTAGVPTGGGVCGEHSVGRYYPREEPDALMSARPGLCGGHRATGVPTAINWVYSLASVIHSTESDRLPRCAQNKLLILGQSTCTRAKTKGANFFVP